MAKFTPKNKGDDSITESKEPTLKDLSTKVLEILQEIRLGQKTIIENQEEIYKQVGGEIAEVKITEE